jgi:hypothetical protein
MKILVWSLLIYSLQFENVYIFITETISSQNKNVSQIITKFNMYNCKFRTAAKLLQLLYTLLNLHCTVHARENDPSCIFGINCPFIYGFWT